MRGGSPPSLNPLAEGDLGQAGVDPFSPELVGLDGYQELVGVHFPGKVTGPFPAGGIDVADLPPIPNPGMSSYVSHCALLKVSVHAIGCSRQMEPGYEKAQLQML